MNILVIVDDAETVTTLRDVLELDGYSVTAMRTVRDAIESGGWSQFTAVLLDRQPMCESADGMLHCLQAAAPHTAVVVVADGAELDAAITSMRHGAADFVLKPIQPDALRATLARVARLKEAEKRVVQAARLAGVGELAASIAHELNNSLSTVTLRVERVLGKTPLDDFRRHALEVIDQEVERMSTLVSNLLQFTRASRDQVSTVDVCDEVARTVELADHHLKRVGVHLELDFDPDVPFIQADRQHLRQVYLNLLTNAADAMPDGGRLTIRVYPGELLGGRPGVVVEVADTGVGIPPEVLPKVTEAFFTTKDEEKGTGLGLAICKRIVEQHRGTMEIESRVGAGTTVRITLPVRPGTSLATGRKYAG